MQRIIITLIGFCLGITGLSAQDASTTRVYGGNSGSPYSAFGIGDLLLPGFGQTAALSGTGIGLRNAYFVNLLNPAALTSIERPVSMILDMGLNFSVTQSGNSADAPLQTDGGLSQMNLWFRFNRSWSSSLGLQPYSKIGYNILADRYNESAGGEYSIVYAGKGGVNRLYWGNAFQIGSKLSVGANLNLLFGTIEDAQYFSSSGNLGSFSVQNKTYLNGASYDAGLQYRIPMGKKELTLGLTYAAPVQLASEKTSQLLAEQDTLELVTTASTAYRVPQKLGMGLSFKHSEKLTLAADFSYQPWSEGKLNDDLELVNTRSLSLGAEFIPVYDKYLGYYQQTLVRAGFRVQNSYLRLDGRPVTEWGLSLGLGLPFHRFRHHLNLTYSYDHRGRQGNNSYQQARHQLGVQVSLRDVWFLRSKLD